MKNKILAKILPAIIILLIFSTTIQVQAAVVWDEDFEGETIETLEEKGWFFTAYEITDINFTQINDHGFEVIDGILRAPSSSDNNTWYDAFQNSTLAYGAWKFDYAPAITPPGISSYEFVVFIANSDPLNWDGFNKADDPLNGYSLWIYKNAMGAAWKIELRRIEIGFDLTLLGLHDFSTPVTGAIHIEITRDPQGNFEVNINNDDTPIIEATDNETKESEYFLFASYLDDTGIDNITIDEPEPPPPPPPTIPASTVGFVIWTVTPTFIILVILRKRVIIKNRYSNED